MSAKCDGDCGGATATLRSRRSGRPRGSRDPRLSLDESRALLRALGDGPTAIAARLGVTRQAVDRALRVGLTVRMARRWGLVACWVALYDARLLDVSGAQ